MDASERQRRVAVEAAEWWVLLQDTATRAEREKYVDWLRESPVHVAEMLRVAQVHGSLEKFQRWSEISVEECESGDANVVRLSETSLVSDRVPRSPTAKRQRRAVLAAAAALLIGATAATVLEIRQNEGTIHTERGERREVALADGSVVQVDPETSLRIRYEKHVRRVFLESGRALFHVAKNSERPFLVQANETTVRAVGTAFAVEKNENDSLLVTVAEGIVAVFARDSSAPPTGTVVNRTPEISGSRTQLLVTAGEQVSVATTGGSETVRSVDSARALAWAEGRLIFDNSSVADAVRQFNRYNRIQIIVNDQTLAGKVINGTFNAADPESFAAFIQSVARVHISRNERADITVDAMN